MREQSEMAQARFELDHSLILQELLKNNIATEVMKVEKLTEEEISLIGKDLIPEIVGDKV